jgi:hypothetical protein
MLKYRHLDRWGGVSYKFIRICKVLGVDPHEGMDLVIETMKKDL